MRTATAGRSEHFSQARLTLSAADIDLRDRRIQALLILADSGGTELLGIRYAVMMMGGGLPSTVAKILGRTQLTKYWCQPCSTSARSCA